MVLAEPGISYVLCGYSMIAINASLVKSYRDLEWYTFLLIMDFSLKAAVKIMNKLHLISVPWVT